MNRFATTLLVFCFLGLGSGALSHLHDLQHAAEDARLDAAAKLVGFPVGPHHHDESNCDTHAQLHLPFMAAGWVAVLVCLGLFVAFLTLLDTPLIPRPLPARIDCRGPPLD